MEVLLSYSHAMLAFLEMISGNLFFDLSFNCFYYPRVLGRSKFHIVYTLTMLA